MLQRIWDKQGLMPTVSSQTTSTWPLVLRERDEQITGYRVGYDAGNLVIQPPREKGWNKTLEEVLAEYAEAWERLATL